MKKLITNIIVLLIVGYLTSEVTGFECYSCWSNVTAGCAVGPVQREETEDCADGDTCLTAIVDKVTYRGCSSSLSLPSDYKNMATCSREFCNSGIFPANRLLCYKCTGVACNSPNGNTRSCVNYVENDQCYTNVESATRTTRGCVSDGNYTATPYSETCTTSLCNVQPSVKKVDCLSCSSSEDTNCIRTPITGTCSISVPNTCSIDLLLGRKDHCYTYHKGDLVQRGCSNTEPNTIIASNPQYYTACSSSNCNNQCISESMCYKCNLDKSESCGGDVSELHPEVCTESNVASCFTCLGSDGNVTRGCGSNKLSDQCESCQDEVGCNKETMRYCYSCSSENDPNCAQWTSPKTINSAVCSTDCVSKIVDRKYTVRGCSSPTLNCNENDVNCKSCSGHLCNDGAVPASKLECYQCQGTTSCSNLNGTDRSLPCTYYQPDDKCVQYQDGTNMVRGCLSDTIGAQCSKDNIKCVLCNTPGCNNIPLQRPSNLSCIQCSSSNNDCSWGFSPDAGSKCKNQVLYFESESCYTNTNNNSRGCTLDGTCKLPGAKCTLCESNDCNNENQVLQSCIQCISQNSTNQNCVNGNSESTACPGTLQTYKDRGCYIMIGNNNIKRGCLAELSANDREICASPAKTCFSCLTQSCNKQSINSLNSSTHLKISLTLCFISLLFVLSIKY